MRMLDSLLLFFVLTLCDIAASAPSSREYVSVPGVGSYKLHEVNKPYHEAAHACEREGAHLAVVNSKQEEDILITLLLGTSRDTAYIGVNDIAVEGQMVTILGEIWDDVGFFRWKEGEPNDNEYAEDCVVLSRDRLLNDQRCGHRLSFFCEKKIPGGSSSGGAATFATFSEGYVTLPGVGSYMFHAEGTPYAEAAQECENEGAHLAVADTRDEEVALVNLLNGTYETLAYIGVNDIAVEGRMVTVFGKPFSSGVTWKWAANEPNDDRGVEDCATIGKDSLMNDQKCGERSSFVCEKNPPNSQGVFGGYVNVAGVGSYMLHEYSLPYSAAARVCEAENAHLAVVNSRAEEDVLMNLLRGSRIGSAYVGVNDMAEEGRMVTVLNEVWSSVGFSKWQEGEPNDADGTEDCVTIGLDGLMTGRKCTEQFGYICEKKGKASDSSALGASSSSRTKATGPGYDTYLTVPGVGSFKFYQSAMIFYDAAYVCENEGAHLAIVNTKAEEDVLINLLKGTEIFLAFVGVNDIAVEGQMVTVFGQLWSNVGYTKWREGEPNDVDSAEDCVVFRGDRLMEDNRCGHWHSFFCEKNSASQSHAQVAAAPFAASFAAGYVTLPGVGSYRLHEEATPYGEAARVCAGEASHLAVVNSKVEEDALINLLVGLFRERAYVGVNDVAVEGFMVTVLGDPLSSASFPKWDNTEPNDDYGIEDCVTLGRDRLMNDQECGIRTSFICEKKTGSSSDDQELQRSGSVVAGYVNVAGVGSYMLHEYSLPYSAAARVCEAENAHLAIVNSRAEEDVLMNLLHGSRLDRAFVGINDIAREGRMVTVHGELWSRVGYSAWRDGEPHDADGSLDCVAIATDRMLAGRKCIERLGYFCEKNTADASKQGAAASYTAVAGVGSYKLHAAIKSYSEAAQVCDSEGAHLAIVNSKIEEDALVNILLRAKKPAVFVGVNDIDVEGQMVTVLGNPLSGHYYKWANGEPRNRNGLEDCATIRRDRLMRVRECGDQLGFICEKKSGCPGLPAEPTVEMECTLNDEIVNCASQARPGTIAAMSCTRGYVHKTRKKFFSITCLAGSLTWSAPLTKCEQDCGRSSLAAQPYVSQGTAVQVGELPWHVGIYKQTSGGSFDQWCGGTLISPNLVASAAHCFWDEKDERQYESAQFRVAAGKIGRGWETSRKETQLRNVAKVLLPARFSGKTNNFQSDIAIVRLARRFDITDAVNVACFDWNEEVSTLAAGDNGTVAGWGLNENGTRSVALTAVQMAYVPYAACWNMFLTSNPEFRKFITADKMCAGWTGKGTAVCPGDSGGGLVFLKVTATGPRYFLRGIVSVGPFATGGSRCNVDAVAAFTDITAHAQFFNQNPVT